MDRGSYRSIYSALTIDPEFRRLSGGAKGLWALLALHPSNGISGIFYFPLSTLAEFTGYSGCHGRASSPSSSRLIH